MSPELIVAALYLFAGGLWIAYSDRVAQWLAGGEPEALGAIQTVKGILFVSVTGVMLYVLSHWAVRRVRRLERRARDYSNRLEYALRCGRQALWELHPDRHAGELLSPEMFTMLGYEPRRGAKGPEFYVALIHPDDRNRVLNGHRKMIKSGGDQEFRMTFRVKNADDEWRTVLSRGRVVERLEDGRASHVIGTNTDITESIRAERLRNETEAQFSRLLKNVPGAVYRCKNDAQWSMLFISEGCRMFTGYTPEQLQGNREVSYADLIVSEDRQHVWGEIQRRLRENEPFELEYRLLDADGNQHFVWERGCGIYNESGTEVIALEGFISDVTPLRKAENQALEMARLAAESPLPVLRVDDKGILKYANPASEELLRKWECRLGKRLPDPYCDMVSQVLESGEAQTVNERVDGVRLAIRFVPVFESGHVNLYATDIEGG